MGKFGRRFYIEAVGLFIVGVLIVYSSVYLQDRAAEKMEIYYFFSPDCPNCKAAKPFMDSLKPEIERKKIKLVELNVKEPNTWSIIYKYIAGKISEKLGTDFLPIPTAIVRRSGRFYTFVGKESVLGLNDFLHLWAGAKKVTARLNGNSFSIEECLSCHSAKNLPPPSTYNCSFCCHRTR